MTLLERLTAEIEEVGVTPECNFDPEACAKVAVEVIAKFLREHNDPDAAGMLQAVVRCGV